MRGKLEKPEGQILIWFGIANLLIGGGNITRYILEPSPTSHIVALIIGIIGVLVGLCLLIEYYIINHPKIPKGPEDSFEDCKHPEIRSLGDDR